MVQFQEAPSRGKKTCGNLPAGHPCPIAKGSGDAMREILDFCIFMSKTELWKYTAQRDADFYRPVPNLFFHFHNSVGSCNRIIPVQMERTHKHPAEAGTSWKLTSAPSYSSFFTLDTLPVLAALVNALPF